MTKRKTTEQEIFDVLSFINGQHEYLEGIEVEGYAFQEDRVKVVKGFFTSSDIEKIKKKFPRVNFDNGLIVGQY